MKVIILLLTLVCVTFTLEANHIPTDSSIVEPTAATADGPAGYDAYWLPARSYTIDTGELLTITLRCEDNDDNSGNQHRGHDFTWEIVGH